MHKKVLAIMLAVCLFVCAVPTPRANAASDVCFVSVNDRLLELSSKAEYIAGVLYVPCTVFSDFKINYSYFPNSSTAMLFTSDKQFFFDMHNGTTYDAQNNYYGVSGAMFNGVAYVPVSFICAQFGLNCSYIPGTGYGDICRVKDGAVVLPDAQFLTAASDLMASRYKAYKNSLKPVTSAPQNTTKPSVGASTVYLSFEGIPAASILDTLYARQLQATFFLTYDDIRANPDTVRRIVGQGHYVGIVCASYQEYERAEEILYEAAHVTTLLVSSSTNGDACRTMAGSNGLIYCAYSVDGVRGGAGLTSLGYVTGALGAGAENYVRLLCNTDTANKFNSLMQYFDDNKYSPKPVTEINHG